jgi:hypothetical protein
MKRISLAIITVSLLLIPAFSYAQSLQNSNSTGFPQDSLQNSNSTGQPLNITPNINGGSATVQNPLGGINSVCGLIKAILGAVIQIGIPIAVLFIVFAGFKFVLARGNSAKLQEARNNLMYTLIGIGIFLGAWLIATVIANTVNSLGAGSGSSQIISCN